MSEYIDWLNVTLKEKIEEKKVEEVK